MKRKKWTEAEEETLISSYSDLVSSCAGISQLWTREKKFQPIADRVNSLHHLRDPGSFPFLWSWRDVSVKIQNMRNQYIGVKLKLSSSSSPTKSPDYDHALHLWPNFLRYKAVFGDTDNYPLSGDSSASSDCSSGENFENLGKLVAELGEVLVGREENRRERRRRGTDTAEMEERRRERWRRKEERREEEEMEWRGKMLEMQMEFEKQAMEMQAEACQAQMQMVSILARLGCQFIGQSATAGAGEGGINGLHHHMMHNLQQQQNSPERLVGGNAKNDVHSGEEEFL